MYGVVFEYFLDQLLLECLVESNLLTCFQFRVHKTPYKPGRMVLVILNRCDNTFRFIKKNIRSILAYIIGEEAEVLGQMYQKVYENLDKSLFGLVYEENTGFEKVI